MQKFSWVLLLCALAAAIIASCGSGLTTASGTEQQIEEKMALEELPRELTLSDISCDLAVNSDGEMVGGFVAEILTFLEHAREGEQDSLRIVSYNESQEPTVMDVTIEESGYRLRVDNSRTSDGTPGISELRLPYLVTDGETVFLSNLSDLSWQEGERLLETTTVPLIEHAVFPEWADITGLVEEMTASRVETDATMARFLSEDGSYWVNLTKTPMEFTVTGKTYGMTRTLTQMKDFAPDSYDTLQIVSAQWLTETTVELICHDAGETDSDYYATFDLQREMVISLAK